MNPALPTVMKALDLLPFLAAKRSPTVIVVRDIEAGSAHQHARLRVAWANPAWTGLEGRGAAAAADGGHVPRLEDRLGANDVAAISAVLDERSHLDDDEEFEMKLEEGVATLTLLRQGDVVVLSIPPAALPPHTPHTESVQTSPPAGGMESRKAACFIDAFASTEMGRRIAAFPWEKSASFLRVSSGGRIRVRGKLTRRGVDLRSFSGTHRILAHNTTGLCRIDAGLSIPDVPHLGCRRRLHVRSPAETLNSISSC